MMDENKKISIIMPAKNEEKLISLAIDNVVLALDSLRLNGEIIVVNDGSEDGTHDIVIQKQKHYSNIKIINNDVSLGIGGAFLKGVEEACEDFVVLIPGDNENDAFSILEIFKDINGCNDLLIPYVVNIEERSVLRRILSKLYTSILNLTFNLNLRYYNGTAIYRKSVFENLEISSKGFFFSAEIILRSLKNKYTYREIPVKLNAKESRKSEALKINSIKKVIVDYFRIAYWFWFSSKGKN